MVDAAVDFAQHFKENLGGRKLLEEGPLYDGRIRYQPGFFVRGAKGKKEKPTFKPTDVGDLWTAQELNPNHLTEQGIQSEIDGRTQNVIYRLPGGEIRVGLYDRRNIDGVAKQFSNGDIKQSLIQLIQANDPDCARIPVLDIRPDIETMLGENFPQIFSYRSVVFSDSTKYGVFVDVDKSLLGQPDEIKGLVLDEEYVKSHPFDMNYLLPMIIQAAKKQGLEYENLLVSDAMPLDKSISGLGSFIKMYEGRYSVKVSYKRTPSVMAVARLNGIPIALSFQSKEEVSEFGFGAREIGNSQFIAISRGAFHNSSDPDNSMEGPIIYEVVSREESVQYAQKNKSFGLFEVQVMRGYHIEDADVQFEKREEGKRVDDILEDRSGAETLKSFGPTGGGSYTAGRSTIGELKQTRIDTVKFGFERVLLRDAFCLVHEEKAADAPSYHS